MFNNIQYVSDPGKPGVRSLGPDVRPRRCADLTDVTLADEDTNSILTDNANGAIEGNVKVTQPGGLCLVRNTSWQS